MSVINALDFNNEVFRGYITWGGILLIKLLLMGLLTGVQRFRKGAYENPEDIRNRENVEIKKDENVERVRRAHLNDLENIPAFLIISLIWIHAEPNLEECHVLMWLYTFARYMHTAVYAYYPVPQPARGICFVVGLLITLYMIIRVFIYFGPWLLLDTLDSQTM